MSIITKTFKINFWCTLHAWGFFFSVYFPTKASETRLSITVHLLCFEVSIFFGKGHNDKPI